MKKVLIVGEGSYLGRKLRAHLEKYSDRFGVQELSVLEPSWKEESFTGIDVIYYVAGIVHRNDNEVSEDKYFAVNCDLTLEVARKAKSEGVKQFIYLSTMSVYGILTGDIDQNTVENPVNPYGKSKLKAEKELRQLETDKFIVAILRPPMIYGKDCKGNFVRLRKLAGLCPVFPKFENERSMLYIENLNLFVEQIIEKEKRGLFFPQDAQWVNTWEMIRLIRLGHGKKLCGTKLFNPMIRLMQKKIPLFQKVWGSLCYSQELSQVEGIDYQRYTLAAAIQEIEK